MRVSGISINSLTLSVVREKISKDLELWGV